MSDAASTAAVYQARIEAPLALGPRIALALEEAHHPSPVAISLFELPQGRCEITAHYATAPAREDLLAVIDGAAGEVWGALSIDAIPANDWVTLSQAKRGPVRAGRFYVHGSHDRAHAPTRRFVVEIDANQAFGTAHHATTRGCLIALDDALKRRPPKCILDLGTGTGVLAIAAANALKARVLASDNDPLAASIAAGNAGANCAGRFVRVFRAAGFAHPTLRRARPDLILANLLMRALHDLAPELARRIAPAGTVVLSGLTADQAPPIVARYRAQGFILRNRIVLEGWATLVMTRGSCNARRRTRARVGIGATAIDRDRALSLQSRPCIRVSKRQA